MFNSIWDDVKAQFRYGNMLTQIILVNTGIFILTILLLVIFFFVFQERADAALNKVLTWFMASYEPRHNLTRPWSWFTYMFLHKDLFHFAWNMIVLYMYGRIFQDFLGTRRTLPLYVFGGFVGFLFYVLSHFLVPAYIGPYCLGASAAIWAIAMATTLLRPDYVVHLMFLGAVRLKYITAVLVILNLIALPQGNTGGQMAHIGGMLAGWYFIYLLKEKGYDMAVPFNKVWDKIAGFFSPFFGNLFGNPQLRTSYKSDSKSDWEAYRHGRNKSREPEINSDGSISQEVIDEILDKINRSGYDSLSKEEKEYLFKYSNKS